jgi:DNA ligase-1
MPYERVASCYDELERTTKRKELTGALVSLFKEIPVELVDRATYLSQGKLYPDYLGIEIGVGEKLAERAISLASGLSLAEVEALYRREGDLGSAAEKAMEERRQTSLFSRKLSVLDVYQVLDRIARSSGEGSVELRLNLLSGLLRNASPLEAKYIVRTAVGKLRLGIADYTVLDALALAYTGDQKNRTVLEKAYNICSDLGLVAKAAAKEGLEGLRSFRIQAGRPVRPMLAERLSSSKEIIEKLGGRCSAEYKYDGERMQVHKLSGEVRIFSRRLEEITSNYPDAQKLSLEGISAEQAILECEAVAVDRETGELLPFQQLMHRRRKYGVDEAVRKIPISLFFFEVLMVDGKDLTGQPYTERRRVLLEVVKVSEHVKVAPNIVTSSPRRMDSFMQQAILDGCEGLVVKDLKGDYRAGARGFSWIKLKREYRSELTDSVDLVIVGGFHGRGRRTGVYGALLLAVYNKDEDTFETVSKVGTGFSDADLQKFYNLLQGLKLEHVSPRVNSKIVADAWFDPRVVIEIIASEITLSPVHTAAWGEVRKDSGLALRFPKFTGRVREDKKPEDATTTKELIEMYNSQLKHVESQSTAIEP